MTEPSDEALLIAYANGDPEAAGDLTRRLLPRVLAQASRVMKGDRTEAEDVAQDAMLRLWKIAPDWRQGEARVTTWLYRVTENLCIDRLRKRRGTVGLETVAEPVDPTPGLTDVMTTQDRAAALEGALAQLPERQRQAVVLRHIDGRSNPEIAEIMDIGVEAVESLTARGKRKLSEILSPRRSELGLQDE